MKMGSRTYINMIPIFIAVISAVIGPLVYIGFFSLYHLIIVGVFVILILQKKKLRINSPIIFFFILWSTHALISVFWAPNKVLAVKYTYYIFLLFVLCAIFHIYIKKITIKHFAYFMSIILLVCNLIAVWEFFTGNHIVEGYLSTPKRLRLLKYVPGAFWKNPNDFATFVIQTIPFPLFLLSNSEKKTKIFAIITIVLSFFSIFATESRTQIIVILIICALLCMHIEKKKLIGIGVLSLVILVIVYNLYPSLNTMIIDGLSSVSIKEVQTSADNNGSMGIRISLIKNAGYILLDTYGFGIGAGCHRTIMSEYASRYYSTNGICVMHNLLGEIFVDYGIFIGISFLIAILSSIRKIIFIFKNTNDKQIKYFARILAIILLTFIICTISSSSIIQLTSLWITICFISAFINEYAVDERSDVNNV